MELIDKNKVLDEIQRMVQSIAKADVNGELASIHGGQQYVLMKIFSFVDNLEVKEVDLNDVIEYDRKQMIDKAIEFVLNNFQCDGPGYPLHYKGILYEPKYIAKDIEKYLNNVLEE